MAALIVLVIRLWQLPCQRDMTYLTTATPDTTENAHIRDSQDGGTRPSVPDAHTGEAGQCR